MFDRLQEAAEGVVDVVVAFLRDLVADVVNGLEGDRLLTHRARVHRAAERAGCVVDAGLAVARGDRHRLRAAAAVEDERTRCGQLPLPSVGLAASTLTWRVPASDSLVALSLTFLLAVLVALVLTLKGLGSNEAASTPLPSLVSARVLSPLAATSIWAESLYQSTPLTVALRLWFAEVLKLSVGSLGPLLSTLTRFSAVL